MGQTNSHAWQPKGLCMRACLPVPRIRAGGDAAREVPDIVQVQVLQVKASSVRECADLLVANARGSRKEPGCLRFDVLRDRALPSRVVTYEAFATPEAAEEHKAQPHTRAWGAFQYGDSKPLISKDILKLRPVDFQSVPPEARAKL